MGPILHNRRSIRLRGWDYASAGAYFVNLVAQDRQCLFGQIVDGRMRKNQFGIIVAKGWRWLARKYPGVHLDAYVVMPNHFHGILVIDDTDGRSRRGGSRTAPTATNRNKRKPLGRLIGAFKTVTAKHINIIRGTPAAPVWQHNYWEHVIRDESEWQRIHNYILANPERWAMDHDNPRRMQNY